MATGTDAPEIDVPIFLQAVRRRPEIWRTTGQAPEPKREAGAWKQICRQTWAEFDSWTVEQKRTRCLVLQRKWRTYKQEFLSSQNKEDPSRRCPYYDLLTFLATDTKNSRSSGGGGTDDGERCRASKRARTEEEPEEDRHFLLSLVSHMRDVPRASKLALREDMLRLVRKYVPARSQPSDTTNSQEY